MPPVEAGHSARFLGWDEEIVTTVSALNNGISLGDTASRTFQLALNNSSEILPRLAGFADDTSHLIFESRSALLPGAVAGGEGGLNVYDLDHGNLTLASRIPSGAAASCDDAGAPACVPAPQGAFAGPYNWEQSRTSQGGSNFTYYTFHAISDDGSRVFFTAAGTGQLYVREDGTRTTRILGLSSSHSGPQRSQAGGVHGRHP